MTLPCELGPVLDTITAEGITIVGRVGRDAAAVFANHAALAIAFRALADIRLEIGVVMLGIVSEEAAFDAAGAVKGCELGHLHHRDGWA